MLLQVREQTGSYRVASPQRTQCLAYSRCSINVEKLLRHRRAQRAGAKEEPMDLVQTKSFALCSNVAQPCTGCGTLEKLLHRSVPHLERAEVSTCIGSR